MTDATRAIKLCCLERFSDYVSLNESNSWVLRWGMPKVNQYIVADSIDGNIEKFVMQTGTTPQETDPEGHKTMIDRRINYLWERHRSEVRTVLDDAKLWMRKEKQRRELGA